MDRRDIIGKSTFEIAPAKLAKVYHKKDEELMNNPGVQIYDFEVKGKVNNSNRQVVFHKATFEKPHQYSEGIEYVVINGKLAVDKGIFKPIKSGEVLLKN